MNNQRSEWIGAREAAAHLGVKLQTLYAYASRGLVASRSRPGGRARQYARDDLDRLKARHDARAGHAVVAAGALRWGEPVLETSIGTITREGPRYRGENAVSLVDRAVPFESVAELLWHGHLPATPPHFAAETLGVHESRFAALITPDASPLAVLASFVQALALADRDRVFNTEEQVDARARSLIKRLAAATSFAYDRHRLERSLAGRSVAETLARALGARRGAAGVRAIDAALVLCADHELNVSTFAARVAASAGADLYACVVAALATLSGPLHGGMCDRVEALAAETATAKRANDAIASRARRGDNVPGFGHPLYPDGDPRAARLLALARELAPGDARTKVIFAIADAAQRAGYGPPVLDLGLVALAHALDLPPGGAATLIAIGRVAGWIAHRREQYAAGFQLRPRARFVGPSRDART